MKNTEKEDVYKVYNGDLLVTTHKFRTNIGTIFAKNTFFHKNRPQTLRRSLTCNCDEKIKIVDKSRQSVFKVHQANYLA